MDVNILRYILICNSITIGSLSLLIIYMKPYLPNALIRFFLFGKINIKANANYPIITKIEMPKKYFGQAYPITGTIMIILFYLALNKYFYNGNIPESLLLLLDILLGASRKPLVSAESTILAIVLFSIHCWKRAYETYYVCVFSNQKINVFHYILTFLHYSMLMLSLIGESEGFVGGSRTSIFLHKLTNMQLICAFIFLWSTYMQLRTNFVLAGLRKNQHGDVISKEHKIPVGELFNYISNPLQFTEILLYLTLSAILWQASTFHYITIFVIVNQVACAIFSDQWYRNTFKNYPKKRKILIPYIW
ncbi:polyprenal reductase [Temnothorax longispinosus]|uniref:polyprenal reductase n=1 Tax=Temnothorax longispinosus TaxID=300112 RepID=UPI003A98EF06